MKTAIVTVKDGRLNVQHYSTIKEAKKVNKLSNAQYQTDIEEPKNYTLSEIPGNNYPEQIDIIAIEKCRVYFFYNPANYDIDFEY